MPATSSVTRLPDLHIRATQCSVSEVGRIKPGDTRDQDTPPTPAPNPRTHHCPRRGSNVCKHIKQAASDCSVFTVAAAVARGWQKLAFSLLRLPAELCFAAPLSPGSRGSSTQTTLCINGTLYCAQLICVLCVCCTHVQTSLS